jgi:uncharacterized repeat protein (TIGR01451 family)
MKKSFLFLLFAFSAMVTFAQLSDNDRALQLVRKNREQIGLTETQLNNVRVSNTYFNSSSNTQLVYLQQAYLDLPVYNQLLVLAFKNDQLVSKAGSLLISMEKKTKGLSGTPGISADQALVTALKDRKIPFTTIPSVLSSNDKGNLLTFEALDIARENITAELMWVPVQDGASVELAWQIYVIPTTSSDYWMVRVNAINNSVIDVSNLTVYCNWDAPNGNQACTDHIHSHDDKQATSTQQALDESPSLVNNATYRVIPFPAESPIHTGGAHTLVTNPWQSAPGNATSLNWHSNGTIDFNYTRGNNVWVQEDVNGNNGTGTPGNSSTPADPLNFDYTPNFTVAPTQTTPNPNQQFSLTNLFYWNNVIHDISYLYGFDEPSGNFQASNQGRGGAGNDFVYADCQDGSGTNNANFATPADGGSGRMQMYLWSGSPQKDGSLDNGIVTHEFTHGISNRLTGGPAQAGCLQNAEQMGEGWSDYFALMYTQNWAGSSLNTGFNTPRGIGTYAAGQSATGLGIRGQRYCTNFSVNNRSYGVTISSQVHTRGEIWCATLWDMTWNIINQVGSINPNIYNPGAGGGNSIALRLVIEGMKLQPCSPGFIDARDAILRADQLLYNGAHQCAIWEAFRRRGMGANASQGSSGSVTDQTPDFTIGRASVQLTQSVTQIPEGQQVTYTNTVTTTSCGGVTNFLLTDTLPTNVTYVSGGTYNAANRVVSFTVTQGAGTTQTYSFTVLVNNGSYYPTVTLFEDNVNTASINPATWTATGTVARGFWSVSTARSFSPDKSYFSNNTDTTSDQRLTLTTAIPMGSTPPNLTFRHWYNTESTYDGGVLEASTDGGTTWTDMQPNIISGGYIATMDGTTLLNGRQAWSGSSGNAFIKTKVNLTPYANQNLKIRFRFTTDVGTNLEGWYVDDIAIKNQALVEIQSNLFTGSGIRVGTSDTFTIILPFNSCTAASISTQPANVNACLGSSATFTATTAGTANTYQWQMSTDGGATWSNIAGATNTTFTISNTTAAMNNYKYRVIVSNACPSSATSEAATLTVSNPAAITTQPTSQTTCALVTTLFSVSATGSGLTYQWQVSTDGGTTFTNIPGATSSTYPISGPSATLNNNQYHVVVTGCNGNITSNNVTLTVNEPANFTTQPSNTSACAGNNASFSVTATGSSLTYQWQISTDGGATWANMPGETNATLAINNVSASMNNNRYRVIINSPVCGSSLTSTGATLTVSNNAVIAAQPQAVSACSGGTASFSVTATGSGLTYQWQVSTDGGISYTNVSGATNSTYALSSISSSLNGTRYRVLVTSACSATGVVSDAGELTVLSAPQVTQDPVNTTLCAGSNASFTSTASGSNISYQWQVSTDGGTTYTNIAGATGTTLTINAISSANNNNRYRVVITSAICGNATSAAAILTVSSPATVTTQPANASVCENTNTTLTVAATGTSLSYQWQLSTDGGTTFNNIAGANTASLALTATIGMNNNRYRVLITESTCGTVTSAQAILTVNATPVVTVTATPSNVLSLGQTITLSASSSAGTIFSWYLNGNVLSGQSGSSIAVDNTGLGNYTVSVTDANGCTGNSATVTVRDTVISFTFIYPNPSKGSFNVRFEGVPYNGYPRLITLYDEKGARVYQKAYTVTGNYQPMPVDVPFLSKGIYTVVLSDASGEILASGKVLLQ